MKGHTPSIALVICSLKVNFQIALGTICGGERCPWIDLYVIPVQRSGFPVVPRKLHSFTQKALAITLIYIVDVKLKAKNTIS